MKFWRAARFGAMVMGSSTLTASMCYSLSKYGWGQLFLLDFWIKEAVVVSVGLITYLLVFAWLFATDERRKQRIAALTADIDGSTLRELTNEDVKHAEAK